jgi:menaquinone-dependent protoporphyrinogen oxidase
MKSVLVLYSSEEGQTRKIATRVAELLAKRHIDVHLRDASKASAGARLATFDGVLIGASVHYAKHAKPVVDFVEEHRAILRTRLTAFYSVSLSAGGPTLDRDEARRYLNEFFDETDWRPDQSAIFAGAIRHSRYSLVRTVMVRLSLMKSGVPDAGDHEYTDWKAVEAFAEDFVKRLAAAPRREGA